MKLSAEQIVQNWEELIKIINDNFTGERKEKLLAMYTDLEDRMCVQPASSLLNVLKKFIHYGLKWEQI